jgi:hypothetical protein
MPFTLGTLGAIKEVMFVPAVAALRGTASVTDGASWHRSVLLVDVGGMTMAIFGRGHQNFRRTARIDHSTSNLEHAFD